MKAIERVYEYLDFIGVKAKPFEEKNNLSNGYLGKQLSRKADLGESILMKIIENCPEINPEWLLTGKGTMLKSEVLSSEKEEKEHTYFLPENLKASVVPVENEKKGIPLLPFDAFAGLGDGTVQGVNFDTIQERYVIPLFDGIKTDFMIPVRGSSMYPKYSSGDVVACRLVSELLFVQWNKVYVIDSISQGVIMKRLLKAELQDHVICRSDNKDYGDFDVPMSDIRSIALVVGVIRLE